MSQTHAPRAGRSRRAYRDISAPIAGGVAAGLAEHLGLPVLAVRAFFVVTAVFSGFGVLLYAALWIFVLGRAFLSWSSPRRVGRARPAAAAARPSRSGGVDKGPAIALLGPLFGFGAVVLFFYLTVLGAWVR